MIQEVLIAGLWSLAQFIEKFDSQVFTLAPDGHRGHLYVELNCAQSLKSKVG